MEFEMSDVLWLLGIQRPHGRSSFYIPCPDCDPPNKRDGHLNINLIKNCFRCPKCGYSGGMLDLYSRFSGIPRELARAEIEYRLGIREDPPQSGDITVSKQKAQIVVLGRPPDADEAPPPKEFPLNDINTRDATYRALLNKLSLASDHKNNLLSRGLTEQVIVANQYRTTPVVGNKAIARQLLDEGYYLSGVPGFYRDEEDEQWTFFELKRGILIPVRDYMGRIQGLQVRRDDVIKRKFRWVSSAEMLDGCGAEGWVHIAGPIREEMLLIEGPMKADIIYHLSGISSFAVPGVNTLKQLDILLDTARSMGVKRFMTAFDMDMMKNHNVHNGFRNLAYMLDSHNFPFGTYLWRPDPKYNGLDDYIWKWCMQSILPIAA